VSRYELVDWTPAKHPPIPLKANLTMRRRRDMAFLTNMHLRKTGTTYIHNGRSPR
jgi:hypothetical protein